MSHTEELSQLSELHRNGDLTDDEFTLAKRKLLDVPEMVSSSVEEESEATTEEASEEFDKLLDAKMQDPSREKMKSASGSSIVKGAVIAAGLLALFALISILGKSNSPTSEPLQSTSNSSAGNEPHYSSQTPETPAPSVPTTPEPMLELQHFSWGESEYGGVAKLSGSVKNIANESLADVEVVGLFYDKKGELITSNDVLISYNPILPGQISPFEVMVPWNPAMRGANVEFKELIGGTIPWREKERKKK